MDTRVKWALFGIGALLAAKYLIVGLDGWNSVLHPGRVEPENLGTFRKPFLGAIR